ncbi:uncharacterized protein [Drosophila pseudoobscura]|uniref:Uncharacterized protein isoform X3 n=1 Tax=Drosophila pseudoobscura pseudoobscura TaxID=46245 RepID=A0A6I8W784_DROPS|nr:uncharacterized protein LOC26532482 isoform X3 [Drosophila pseudoobscura]
MCQAEQFFQAKHFCRYLSLRSGGLIIALFSDLLAIVSLAGFFRLFFDRTSENMIRGKINFRRLLGCPTFRGCQLFVRFPDHDISYSGSGLHCD